MKLCDNLCTVKHKIKEKLLIYEIENYKNIKSKRKAYYFGENCEKYNLLLYQKYHIYMYVHVLHIHRYMYTYTHCYRER